MKKLIVLFVCVVGIMAASGAGAVTVCGELSDPDGTRMYISSGGSLYRCLTNGSPADLPDVQYVCAIGTGTTEANFGFTYGYNITDCQLNDSSSRCDYRHRYNGSRCVLCGNYAYADTDSSGYHRYTTCAYCAPGYKKIADNECEACPSDRLPYSDVPHQSDMCGPCRDGWDDGTNCHPCPCGGSVGWYFGDITSCALYDGQSCYDDSGDYVIEGGTSGCYYSSW